MNEMNSSQLTWYLLLPVSYRSCHTMKHLRTVSFPDCFLFNFPFGARKISVTVMVAAPLSPFRAVLNSLLISYSSSRAPYLPPNPARKSRAAHSQPCRSCWNVPRMIFAQMLAQKIGVAHPAINVIREAPERAQGKTRIENAPRDYT